MTDSVLIEGLAVEAIIGVYDWEREVSQRLLVDLEMAWDNRAPAASDDVSDALNYALVSERVSDYLVELAPNCWKPLRKHCRFATECIQRALGQVDPS